VREIAHSKLFSHRTRTFIVEYAHTRSNLFFNALTVTAHVRRGIVAHVHRYTLQGLANREAPRLLFDNGFLNVDFPGSDEAWKTYFERERGVTFTTVTEPELCALVAEFASSSNGSSGNSNSSNGSGSSSTFHGAVRYSSDGVSVFVAMTVAGDRRALPVSTQLADAYPCLRALPVVVELPRFANKFDAYEWALENVNSSMSVVYNADVYVWTHCAYRY
jgi:hypothetical protein